MIKNTKRNPLIIGHCRDVEGGSWDVRDIRDTKHGFDLLFGSPADWLGSYRGGLPRLIATRPLVEYWEANKTKHDGIIYDLPAGRSTLKRVRKHLRFNYHRNVAEYWRERMDDLKTLRPREFASRHNIPMAVVHENRLKLLGKSARELNWWQTPATIELLLSGQTLRAIGEKLGIRITHTKRLRVRARQLQTPSGEPGAQALITP
jgi:hypothetical protein